LKIAIVLGASDPSISAGWSPQGLAHKEILFTSRNYNGKESVPIIMTCFVDVEVTKDKLYFCQLLRTADVNVFALSDHVEINEINFVELIFTFSPS
jgi:hypothetical protein